MYALKRNKNYKNYKNYLVFTYAKRIQMTTSSFLFFANHRGVALPIITMMMMVDDINTSIIGYHDIPRRNPYGLFEYCSESNIDFSKDLIYSVVFNIRRKHQRVHPNLLDLLAYSSKGQI
jgi:hypothetical protein